MHQTFCRNFVDLDQSALWSKETGLAVHLHVHSSEGVALDNGTLDAYELDGRHLLTCDGITA